MLDYVAKVEEHQSRASWEAWMTRLMAECLIRRVLTRHPLQGVLDFGCGPGKFTRMLRDKGVNVVGYDARIDMVARARFLDTERVGSYVHRKEALCQLYWDVVFVTNVLGHLPDPRAEIAWLRDRMERNARLVIFNPNVWHTRLRKLPDLLSGYEPDPTLRWHWSLAGVTKMIEAQGFKREWAYFDGWSCLGVKSNYAACFVKA